MEKIRVKASPARIIVAGLAGGLALGVSMTLTFRLLGFGWDGGGILLDPEIQSPKLIAVWTTLKPRPLIVSNPLLIFPLLTLLSVGHAIAFQWLAPAWPAGVVPRALRYAALTFFLTFCFWELFTPYNLFGEPLLLLALELMFWGAIALCEAFAISWVLEAGTDR